MKIQSIIIFAMFFGSWIYCYLDAVDQHSRSDKNEIIERALGFEVQKADKIVLQEASQLCKEARKKVEDACYEEVIKIITLGLKKYPRNFVLQASLASLIGDCSEITPNPIKERMIKYSKELFDKLIKEVDEQPKHIFYPFMNEYYYRFALYNQQYELGIKRVDDYWHTEEFNMYGVGGYYSQGVGAANYARILLEEGNRVLACDYAQKAIVAWAQYFSYKNDYYNSYVHYAMALGICGYKEEMMRALEKSASIIGKDLSYFEFREVIDFINAADKSYS